MDFLAAPQVQPFAVAGLILVILVAIEIATTLAGFSVSHAVDKGLHLDGDPGAIGGLLGWVNAGRVPMMVLILIALAAFSAAGFAIQAVASGIWEPLPALPASLLAGAAAAPFTRASTRVLSRLVPRDETYAVSADDLVGRVAEVTVGPLDGGAAGRVQLKDAHGNLHFPLARAAEGQPPLPTGSLVLLVGRQDSAYLAISAPDELKPLR